LCDEAATPRYWLNRYDNATRSRTAPASSEGWPVAPRGGEYRFEPVAARTPGADVPRYRCSPSYLLDSDHEVVPFRDRPELALLESWRDDAASLRSIQLLHGDGGQGKTRMARRFAANAARRGWRVVQALERGRVIPPDRGRSPATGGGRLLVVVDYAERWPLDVLEQLVADLSADPDVERLRVLLLARSGDALWELIRATVDRQVDHAPEPIYLGWFTTDLTDLRQVFDEAVTAFQRAMGFLVADLDVPLDGSEVGRSPLDLHMTALAAVLAHHDHHPVPEDGDLTDFC
jgi:hypothetical protein